MSIVKRNTGILAGQEPANPVGKAMILGGGGALAVGAIAALLPGGFLIWAIIMLVAGAFIF